jgi:hypothetical protein
VKARIAIIIGLLVLAASIATGCGGGGSGNEGDQGTVAAAELPDPRAEFIQQAERICLDAESRQLDRLKQFGKRYGNPRQASEVKIIRLAGLPPLQTEEKELGRLKPPKHGSADAVAFIREFGKALKEVEANPTALLSGSPFATAKEKAKRYGFKYCGGP